ncbi:MAG: hypothetical protein HXX80_01780 [Nitrososphaerales archaeon]|nr:hypothetical protein [Nitrososphaerales archaeon]
MEFEKRYLIVVIFISAILVGAIAIFYYPSGGPPGQRWLQDPEDDVILNFNADYPGMIDIIYAELSTNEQILNFTLTMKDSVPESLEYGEYVQWLVLIIFEDGTAYEMYAEINSTIYEGELSGFIREVGEYEAQPCILEHDGKTLILSAPLEGLEATKEVQWVVQTVFEKWSGYELISNGFDFAPDEDLQRTTL